MIVTATYDGTVLRPLEKRDAHILSTKCGVGEVVKIDVKPAGKRSLNQNRLQHLWHNEAAGQLGDETAEQKRAYCKLHHGVPILRAENEDFREQYDRIIRPLSYEQKLDLMGVPIDFPVTRLMSVRQMTAFLDAIHAHYTCQGVILTVPDEPW